jgi:hypothetical protein
VDLTLRPDVEPSEVVHGTAELLRVLNAREVELGGSGLVFDTRRHPSEKGKARLVLYPKTEAGAKERLQQLTVLASQTTTRAGQKGSFVECHAAVA